MSTYAGDTAVSLYVGDTALTGAGGVDLTDYLGSAFTADTVLLSYPTRAVSDGAGTGRVAPSLNYAKALGAAIGTYGDELDGTLSGVWTLRNCTTTGSADGQTVAMNDAGDALTRTFTDPAANFEILVCLEGVTDPTGMIGICALDSSGNGVAYSPYTSWAPSFMWNIAAYNYSSTGASGASLDPGVSWLHMRRVGTAWSGRGMLGTGLWSAWSSTFTDSRTITRVGVVRAFAGSAGAQSPLISRFVYGTTSISGL